MKTVCGICGDKRELPAEYLKALKYLNVRIYRAMNAIEDMADLVDDMLRKIEDWKREK